MPNLKTLTLATALAVTTTVSAHAQNWMYQSGQGGTAPFAYGSSNPYGVQPSYIPAPLPSLPEPPEVRSYIPQPSQGPSGYPCTMPGCRY